jgi:hypothetical protein
MFGTDFYYQHFIVLNPKTVNCQEFQHILASSIVFYAWEIVANRYAKLNYSVLVHHWFTIFASLAILLGMFTPFATWYGICSVIMAFPVSFSLGFRAVASKRHPHCTRLLFVFTFYWYLLMIILDFGGQFFILIHGLMTGKIAYWTIISIVVAIAGWAWDDYHLMRAMYLFANQAYEQTQLQRDKNQNQSKNKSTNSKKSDNQICKEQPQTQEQKQKQEQLNVNVGGQLSERQQYAYGGV